MNYRRALNGLRRVLAGMVVLLTSGNLYAQSCVMCATSAAAANPGGLRALKIGLVALLIPPLLIFSGIFLFAFRYRNTENGEDRSEAVEEGEGMRQSGLWPASETTELRAHTLRQPYNVR